MIHNKKIILTFGYLPKTLGGGHKAGIGIASFELQSALSNISENFICHYASIDFLEKEKVINKVKVHGFVKSSIIKFMMFNPITLFKLLFNVVSFPKKYNKNKLKTFFVLLYYTMLIKQIKPDVVSFNGVLDIIYSKYIPLFGIRTIGRIHGINNNKIFDKSFIRMEEDVSLTNLDYLTFLSESIKNEWEKLYGKLNINNSVLLNGFNKEYFYFNKRDTSDELRLLTIGSITERKGQFRVLKAINKLNNNKNIKYKCIGVDSKGIIKEMQEFSKENKIDFTFLDYVPQYELQKHISEADFLILPSIIEGFGLVFIESIACGTPVIIPKHLPLVQEKNILSDKNSILLENYDIEAITRGLLKANKNKFIKREISETVSHLSWENIAIKYELILLKILK